MNYSCELCNTTYKTNKTLLNHNNKFHTNDISSIFKCPNCDSKFTRKNNMVDHIKNKCKNKKELTNYKCNKCNKDYKSFQSLWNHNNTFQHLSIVL